MSAGEGVTAAVGRRIVRGVRASHTGLSAVACCLLIVQVWVLGSAGACWSVGMVADSPGWYGLVRSMVGLFVVLLIAKKSGLMVTMIACCIVWVRGSCHSRGRSAASIAPVSLSICTAGTV